MVTSPNHEREERVSIVLCDDTYNRPMSHFANTIYQQKYAWKDENGNPIEDWNQTVYRVVSNVLGSIGYSPGDSEFEDLLDFMQAKKFLPGGRYLYASGRDLHQTQNCLLLRAEDSREGWADLAHKAAMALMTGAGIGADYSELRPSGTPIKKTGGVASGPISLMKILNEIGRNVMQGGSRRSAIWAGLSWKHQDIFDFIKLKNWPKEVRSLKEKDFNFPATMDMTNISVILDDEFFRAFENRNHPLNGLAEDVYWDVVAQMTKTAEPGFSIDVGINAGETLRNACTEITSADDSDICNLGSINMARVKDIEEFDKLVKLGTLFLLAGTVYSHLPYAEVYEVRSKNRRLGLGLMGIHEWLLQRGKPYGPDSELAEWLDRYTMSTQYANSYADYHGLSRPIKTRAIAPNGTIGIVAETTTGIEPIFCVSYKRRYKTANANGNDRTQYQYVIDPTAKRLIENGVDPQYIEDAYMLSFDVERRIEFQAWVQKYVDHAISSTINLPYTIEDPYEVRQFGEMLYRYLPHLRGVTVYPDGARGGQPLQAVPYQIAISQEGTVFEEHEDKCVNGACGV